MAVAHEAVVEAVPGAAGGGDHGWDPGHGGGSLPAAPEASAAGAVWLTAEAEHQEDQEAEGEEGDPTDGDHGYVLVHQQHNEWCVVEGEESEVKNGQADSHTSSTTAFIVF